MSGSLIDMFARHQPEDTAVEAGEQQTSYKQLLGLTRAIREQIRAKPCRVGPGRRRRRSGRRRMCDYCGRSGSRSSVRSAVG